MRIRDSSATMSQRCGGCPMASTALCHERSMGRERSHCHSQIERRTSCRPQGRYRKDRHFTADGKVRCMAYLDRIDRYRHEIVAALSREFCAFKMARSTKRAFRRHRSEEHTSELQSLMRISYAVFCLKKKNHISIFTHLITTSHPSILTAL